MGEKKYIGVDLGGTNIKIGLVGEDGRLISHLDRPTETKNGADFVMERIAQMAKDVTSLGNSNWEEVVGIGIGSPGFLDVENGIVKNAYNLGFVNVPIVSRLKELLQLPVRLDNDANVAALGEVWSGAGKGYKDVVCVTLGTGVGGGVIINGQLIHGKSMMAGEIGHMPIVYGEEARQCTCGKLGCLETIASATGIVKSAVEAVERGETTQWNKENVSARMVYELAGKGDTVASRIVRNAADVLGRALATIAVTINPERFVIGGGLSQAGETLYKPLQEAFVHYGLADAVTGVDIVPATLGNDAGVIGAAGIIARS